MTSPAPESGRSTATVLLTIALIGSLSFASYSFWRADTALAAQKAVIEKNQESLEALLGEITRMRIEQSAVGKGPAALLEKLKVFAPLTADARTTEPDFQNAKKELQAIVRAFESCGKDVAWAPVTDRLEQVDPKTDFNEIKYLLEIAIRLDGPSGKQITKEVLQGHRLPFPRLRWWAADLLLSHDKPLAANLLRQILMTESSRGFDINRAGSGAVIPDPAAFSTTGFNNYVQRYIRSEDSKLEDTLLMLITRVEHDSITIQDSIKELAKRKCQRALPTIKRVYDDPPHSQQNPLFFQICARAVDEIAGKAEMAWYEEKLKTAPTDIVAKTLTAIIEKHKNK